MPLWWLLCLFMYWYNSGNYPIATAGGKKVCKTLGRTAEAPRRTYENVQHPSAWLTDPGVLSWNGRNLGYPTTHWTLVKNQRLRRRNTQTQKDDACDFSQPVSNISIRKNLKSPINSKTLQRRFYLFDKQPWNKLNRHRWKHSWNCSFNLHPPKRITITNKNSGLADIRPFHNLKPDSRPVILELPLIMAAIMTVAATETQHSKMNMRLTVTRTASPLTRLVCAFLCSSKTSLFFSFRSKW